MTSESSSKPGQVVDETQGSRRMAMAVGCRRLSLCSGKFPLFVTLGKKISKLVQVHTSIIQIDIFSPCNTNLWKEKIKRIIEALQLKNLTRQPSRMNTILDTGLPWRREARISDNKY